MGSTAVIGSAAVLMFLMTLGGLLVIGVVLGYLRAEKALRQAHDNLAVRIAERTRGLNQEIENRKQAEQALQESENTARLVTDSVPALIAYIDAEERYRFVNKPYRTSFGFESEDIIGKHIKDIIGEELYERTLAKRNAVMLGKSQQYEEGMVDGEGKSRHIQVALVPQFGKGGGVLGYYTMIQDITERQHTLDALVAAKGKAEVANRAKSEFLTAMSHELRTPLNSIIGLSEIIKNETFGPVRSVKYREYSNDIHEAGQHLLGLINDILDLSKVELGTDELHEEKIEVPEIVRSSLKLVGHRAEQGGIKA